MKRTPYAHIFTLIAFLLNIFGTVPMAQAQDFSLPTPGVMVHLSPPMDPPILKGIKVHPDNPFRFDFILDKGDSFVIPAKAGIQNQEQLKQESTKLIKYFLASLTIPEDDLWVNLSPYEKDRIIPQGFGLTEMGRDLLAEDYMLKQITASLIYPEDEIGKKFWKRIYEVAEKKYGTTNIPVNTFNKVWIVPEKAVVYENAKAGTAYVVESKLKVMLEQDYLSLTKHEGIQSLNNVIPATSTNGRSPEVQAGILNKNDINALGSQIVREIVIPELTKEVNENKNFSQLRQVYNSLILATWYKKKIKDSILEQVYANKNKVAGVNIDDPQEKERIYQKYLRAFKKGVFNYIKEDTDSLTQETVPRKYFSGGVKLLVTPEIEAIDDVPEDQLVDTSHEVEETVDAHPLSAAVMSGENDNAMRTETPDAQSSKSKAFFKNLIVLESRLSAERNPDVKQSTTQMLRKVYLKMVEGEHLTVEELENRLNAESDSSLREVIISVLVQLYLKMVKEGGLKLDELESRLSTEKKIYIREVIIHVLEQVYQERIEQGQEVSLDVLINHLDSEKFTSPQRAILEAIGSLSLKKMERGQEVSFGVFESRLGGANYVRNRKIIEEELALLYLKKMEQEQWTLDELGSSIRREAVNATWVGMHYGMEEAINKELDRSSYLKMMELGQKISLAALQRYWKTERDPDVTQAIRKAIEKVYLEKLEQGKVSLSGLESLLKNDFGDNVKPAIAYALGQGYLQKVEQGYFTIEELENRVRTEENLYIKDAIVPALALLYQKKVEQEQIRLDFLLSRLNSENNIDIQLAIIKGWGLIYLDMVKRGEEVSLTVLESYLDPKRLYKLTTVSALVPIYLEMVEQGKKVSLNALENCLNEDNRDKYSKQIIAQALIQVSQKMAEKGQEGALALVENYLNAEKDHTVGKTFIMPLSQLYLKKVAERQMKVTELEHHLNAAESFVVQEAIIDALGQLYLEMVDRGEKPSLDVFESRLKGYSGNSMKLIIQIYQKMLEKRLMTVSELENRLDIEKNSYFKKSIIDMLGVEYLKMVEKGEKVSLTVLENQLNTEELGWMRAAIIEVLGQVYFKMMEKGEKISSAVLEKQLEKEMKPGLDRHINEAMYSDSQKAIIKALSKLYLWRAERGERVPIEVLEKLLDTREYSSVRDEIVDALGPLYLKMVEQGYLTSEDLEKRLNSEWGTDARHAILNVLSFVYPRMIEEKNFSPEGFMRYSLWIKENFPYEEEIFESFWDSSDPVRFVEQIKREAHQVIENGFDYNDPKKLWFAYVAVRSSGIVLTRDEFEERIGELIKFDKKNPGYWQMLFNKTKGLGVLNVSATEYENI